MKDAADRDRDAPGRDEPRFVADCMLGRLARWLRLLGYDVVYDSGFADREIARIAVREGRVVLTRDRQLLARRAVRLDPPGLLVDDDDLAAQLRIVLDALSLRPREERMFTRCSRCNGALVDVSRSSVRGRVPPFVSRTATGFSLCGDCGQVYWDGTHRRLVRRRLAALLPPGAAGARGGS